VSVVRSQGSLSAIQQIHRTKRDPERRPLAHRVAARDDLDRVRSDWRPIDSFPDWTLARAVVLGPATSRAADAGIAEALDLPISRLTNKSKPCVLRWQERYNEHGVVGPKRDRTLSALTTVTRDGLVSVEKWEPGVTDPALP